MFISMNSIYPTPDTPRRKHNVISSSVKNSHSEVVPVRVGHCFPATVETSRRMNSRRVFLRTERPRLTNPREQVQSPPINDTRPPQIDCGDPVEGLHSTFLSDFSLLGSSPRRSVLRWATLMYSVGSAYQGRKETER
jgi:hypothetical protein